MSNDVLMRTFLVVLYGTSNNGIIALLTIVETLQLYSLFFIHSNNHTAVVIGASTISGAPNFHTQ